MNRKLSIGNQAPIEREKKKTKNKWHHQDAKFIGFIVSSLFTRQTEIKADMCVCMRVSLSTEISHKLGILRVELFFEFVLNENDT